MAITTYAELKTAISRIAGGSDSASATTMGMTSTIDDVVTLAETRIYREVRCRDMEAVLNTTSTVPSDYVELKQAYVDSSTKPTLLRRPATWIYEQYPDRSSYDLPKFIAREGSTFIFGPPNSSYTIRGIYYRKFPALSTQLNPFFSNNPDLFLFASLCETTIFIGRDDRIQLWEAKYQKIKHDLNTQDNKESASGSGIAVMAV